MRNISLLITASLILPGLARAQAPDQTLATQAPDDTQARGAPIEPPATQPAVTRAAPDEKSPAAAFQGALLASGVGIGLMVAGMAGDSGALGATGFALTLVGPSFGHFYAGETWRGLTHVSVRAAAAVIVYTGFVWSIGALVECLPLFGEEPDCDQAGAPLLLLGGLVLGGGSIVYSIHDAPRAVRRYNARARARQITIMPAPMVGPDRSTGLGLQLGGRF